MRRCALLPRCGHARHQPRVSAVHRPRRLHLPDGRRPGARREPHRASVWTVPAGAATPAREHDAPCVVLVLAGSGKHRIAGAPQHFRGPCTLLVPPGAEHEIVNTGALPLQIVVIVVPTAATGRQRADPPISG